MAMLHTARLHPLVFCLSRASKPMLLFTVHSGHTWGRYHGDWQPSIDDSFHNPTVIPPSALDKPSIKKRYHRYTSPCHSPTTVTLHDSRFVECRWWNNGWTVKTVVTWRSSASMIPAPGHLILAIFSCKVTLALLYTLCDMGCQSVSYLTKWEQWMCTHAKYSKYHLLSLTSNKSEQEVKF